MNDSPPRHYVFLASAVLAALLAAHGTAQQAGDAPDPPLTQPLGATAHPPIPKDPFRLWLAPVEAARRRTGSPAGFTTVARLIGESKYAQALPLLTGRFDDTPLADYAEYYRGLVELRLAHTDEARRVFAGMLARPLRGYLAEAVRLRAAEAAETAGDFSKAVSLYDEVLKGTPLSPPDVLLSLARVARSAGDVARSQQALARVYYEYPLSDQAVVAQSELDSASAWQPLAPASQRYKLELGRAQRLFGARQYAQAQSGFELVSPYASGDEAELVALRRAECDFYLRRYKAAHDALEPWITKAGRRAEAQFFYLSSARELGQHDEYVRLARELVAAFPTESWAEETLNNLATHYILVDDDEAAEGVFREIVEKYPQSRHAERAAWRSGWFAYRRGEYATAIQIFEAAAARSPRSDYRPSWVYWAARAHEQLGHKDTAAARYALVVTDYQNSYYGRLAATQLDDRKTAPAVQRTLAAAPDAVPDTELPPTHALIRHLIANELYADAMNELQYAQRAWGDSPAIEATIGLVYAKTGELRRGINAMKRAYPQYIAAGGEELPPDMLKVLFPVAYWDSIRKYSAAHKLDPYVMAALIAQESTFDPDIKSHANAVGLMQVLPSTGRQYARKVGIRRFRASMLTNPDINLRLGTAIFSDLVTRYGGTHLALASYNAGGGAVARWVAERPGIARDEFIDDIPYPETQNYVRKILGTADDYRRLYGELHAQPATVVKTAATGSGGSSVSPARPAASKKKVSKPSKKRTHRKPAPRKRRSQ